MCIRDSGDYIDLEENLSFIEVGGWADGQSFGNNWLEGEISKLSITTNQDSLLLSNGQVYTSSGLIHYVGEVFGGGVVFQVWKDQSGTEHGLIVDLVDLGSSVWSNVDSPFEYIGATAEGLNGMNNSQAIIDQNGHTTSAASLCMGSNNGGFTDWFLPSISELNALQNNYTVISRVLFDIGGQALTNNAGYWSSNEKMVSSDPTCANCSQAIWLRFEQGAISLGAPSSCDISGQYKKCLSKAVRAIRDF